MAGPEVTLVGTLQRNMTEGPEGAGYRLNNVTVEVDMSEVGALDPDLEGQPVSVEGRFETREHPESGRRLVFKARAANARFAGGGGPESTPPPGGSRTGGV